MTTDQEIYSYLQDKNKPGFLKVLTPNYVKTIEGEYIYFDYNNDGIITENEKYIEGGYQGRDLQNNYLFIDENNYVFYFDKNGNRVLNDEEGIPHTVNSTGSYIPYLWKPLKNFNFLDMVFPYWDIMEYLKFSRDIQ